MPMNDYLVNAEISLLEQKLNLKESVGFNPNDFPYQKHWDNLSELEYNLLISKAEKCPTLVGVLNQEANGGSYKVTIIYYKGRYITMLKEVNGTDFFIGFYKSYFEALDSIRVEALILDICRKDRKGK